MDNAIMLNLENAGVVFSQEIKDRAKVACELLYNAKGEGNDFLGWVNLPSATTDNLLENIRHTSLLLQQECQIVVVVGIGGSYLGARAVIDALSNSFDAVIRDRKYPLVLYAGQNIGEDYLFELQELLKNYKFGIISISKSGTTTEPALAFRLLREQLERQQGKEAAKRLIVAVTDRSRGALKTLADKQGYRSYVIEDNIGGRFSVLSPVGLLPIAVAGFDIKRLIEGAKLMEKNTSQYIEFEHNIAMQYAAVRNVLYNKGKKIEVLANFNPKLHYISEWWKQLYGESEGKKHKGIFPASVDFTTDLHSMGQYLQEGERILFETVISVEKSNFEYRVIPDNDNLDGLNFLAGRKIDHINKMAELGTMIAHVDGGVPNIKITLPQLDEASLGQLIYFFEKACGISGYMLGVNPFDQPGVEAYKKNMFALLQKPGYEAEYQALQVRLSK
ncbi:glucose-6-phosphate isomerase [Porphyromonadaceae bacterium COT-184 OH4590]|nr:glucose-6-phosphate isomerase [Porphyromonadaceae bacterium COT-184 OH4590]MDO4727179.1 glucose-6-phosphate isomerase [Porphyromonadaceae bacterium]